MLMRILWIMVITALLTGCTLDGVGGTPPPTMTVSGEREMLEPWFDLDTLPAPSGVQWTQRVQGTGGGLAPGPTDYVVVAVLTYDEPVEEAIASLGLEPRANITVGETLTEAWLPAALAEHIVATPEGYLRFEGAAYDAGPVLGSPLTAGYILVVDRYVVLVGFTT